MSSLSFIECFEKIIAVPTISAFDPKMDQSNRVLID
ncbi:MAG: hypothetical protein ACI9C4_002193, partial [Paraglaciecola sp.]